MIFVCNIATPLTVTVLNLKKHKANFLTITEKNRIISKTIDIMHSIQKLEQTRNGEFTIGQPSHVSTFSVKYQCNTLFNFVSKPFTL